MNKSFDLFKATSFLAHLFFATIVGIVLGTLLFLAVNLTESVTLELYEQNRTHSRIRFFYDMEQARRSCRDQLFATITDYHGYEEVYVCALLEKNTEPAV